MKILFLVNTPNVYTGHTVEIDRPDLTRRLDCINTWVPEVLEAGHEVLFYVGGASKDYYDEETLTLHLNVETGYEPAAGEGTSVIFKKNQAAYRWILEHRTFDVVFSGEDDMYINLPEFLKVINAENFNIVDAMTMSGIGGGGFILNRKALEHIVSYENTTAHVADHATVAALGRITGYCNVKSHSKFAAFYWPAELYGMMHYAVGKKVYHIHHMLQYFREHGYTNRKIILGGPLDTFVPNKLISYEITARRRTPRWYDFTTDPNNWEYHLGYGNSAVMPVHWIRTFWPYAPKATKYFVLNYRTLLTDMKFGSEQFMRGFNFYIENCERSLINPDNLILCSPHKDELSGWKVDNSVKSSLKLNFEQLNDCNFYRRT